MGDTVRFGFVGCGEIAKSTARSLAKVAGARVTACFDPNPASANDLKEMTGAEPVASVEALLARDDVDAVYLATPHDLHAPGTLAALAAGKHVLVEKPVALREEDARAMDEAARKAGRIVSVAYLCRYFANSLKAAALMREGVIGEVIGVRVLQVADKAPEYWTQGVSGKSRPTDWRASKARAGGGQLIMNASHMLDLAYHLTGLKATRVYAEADTFRHPVEVEDYAEAVIRYENGAIGHVAAAACARGGWRESPPVTLYGREGQLAVRNFWGSAPKVGLFRVSTGEWEEIETPKGDLDSRGLLCEAFVRAVRGEGPNPVSIEQATEALRIVLAAYRAAETGEAQTLG